MHLICLIVKRAARVEKYAGEKIQEKDSIGGIIECVVTGMMPGIGDPVFDKLDANLAKAIMSIGAVKGFEIGDGLLRLTVQEVLIMTALL